MNKEQEYLKAEMLTEDYFNLPNEVRLRISINTVDVKDFDYSFDERWIALYKNNNVEFIKLKKIEYDYPFKENELWLLQKKISTKAYKDLKKREFELRTNHKK